MYRASSDFPLPGSPVITTGVFDAATRRVNPREPRREQPVAGGKRTLFPGAPHKHVNLGEAIRFRHVVIGAEPHRGDRRVDGPVAGNDDALRGRRVFTDMAQHFDAVHFRHHDVEQRDVERLGAQNAQRRATVTGDGHLVTAPLKVALQQFAEMDFIFGDEEFDGLIVPHWASTVGRITRNVEP
jgi:hypothetical protein